MVLIQLRFYAIYLAEGLLYHLNASVPDGLFSDLACLFTDIIASKQYRATLQKYTSLIPHILQPEISRIPRGSTRFHR